MDEPDIETRRGAWTRYWRSGVLHSCAGSWDGNYGGAIAAFWRRQSGRLRARDRVLDLGTGNGPVPAMLLATLGPAEMPSVDAIDGATPAPAWLDSVADGVRERIRFHAATGMESLPFADRTFDRVFSQFGFEYADRGAAVVETARVLKPGGAVAFICHHADSVLVRVAEREVGHIDWLRTESGLFDAVRRLLPFAARSGTTEGVAGLRTDPEANAARARFNGCASDLQRRAETSEVPDILYETGDALMRTLDTAARHGVTAGTESMDAWEAALADAALRSSELVRHALDRTAVNAILDAFARAGVAAGADVLLERDAVIAWTVSSS